MRAGPVPELPESTPPEPGGKHGLSPVTQFPQQLLLPRPQDTGLSLRIPWESGPWHLGHKKSQAALGEDLFLPHLGPCGLPTESGPHSEPAAWGPAHRS